MNLLGKRAVQEILLSEGRDDVTRAYLAARLAAKDAKLKKLLTKLSDAVFKAVPEQYAKDLEAKKFKTDFLAGLQEWAVANDPTKTEMGKLRYELALFVGEHNVNVLFKEVVPSLKENPWAHKLNAVCGSCVN